MARALVVALCVFLVVPAVSSLASGDCDLNVFIDGWVLDSSTYLPIADAEVCLGYNCVLTDATGAFSIEDHSTVKSGQFFPSYFCIDISSAGYPPKQFCVARTKSPFPPCSGTDLTLRFNLNVVFLNPVSTDVSDAEARPRRQMLLPNTPNPFNPSTQIPFVLAEPAYATVEVFDVLGRRVATPVSESLEAGEHAVEWDARNESSGAYFYRLTAGEFSVVRKMLLLK